MNIEGAKLKIIQIITNLQSEVLVSKILMFVTQFSDKKAPAPQESIPSSEANEFLALASQPTPDTFSVEQLQKEQNYSTQKLRDAIQRIDHSLFADENIDELLAEIK
jgi:hypothetical protein